MNAGKPMDLLTKALGSLVLVELKGKRKIRGRLMGFDQHLNLVLVEAEEFDEESNESVQLNTVIVRGDNVILVSPPPEGKSEGK